MKDIFISHSSKDRECVKEICSFLENEGYSCWVCYRREDLRPGEMYTSAISKAIKRCKIFLMIVSKSSIESVQVHNELVLANGRVKDGMVIIPILIEDGLKSNELHPAVDYVLAGKQSVIWKNKEEREELRLRVGTVVTQEKMAENRETKNLKHSDGENKKKFLGAIMAAFVGGIVSSMIYKKQHRISDKNDLNRYK